MEIAEKVLRVLKESPSVSKENLDLIYDVVIDFGISSFKEEVLEYLDLVDYFIRSSFNIKERNSSYSDDGYYTVSYDINISRGIDKIAYNPRERTIFFSGSSPEKNEFTINLDTEYPFVYSGLNQIFVSNKKEIRYPDFVTRDFTPSIILVSERRGKNFFYLRDLAYGIMQKGGKFFEIYIGDKSEVIINGIN